MIVRLYRRLRALAVAILQAPGQIDRLQAILGDLAVTRASLATAAAAFSTRADRIERDLNVVRQLLCHLADRPQRNLDDAATGRVDVVAEPTADPDRDQVFQTLQQRYPNVFPLWDRLFRTALDSYLQMPDENLSTEAHGMAPRFGAYVTRFATGRVLDIGCGPLALPCYLADLDPAKLAAIDPLSPLEAHPFVFRYGVAEAIPWAEGAFETVIAATSLDHVISIHAALREIRRVLSDGGRFITWVGFIPGGRPFDPEQENPVSADQYHLFHFDEAWMEEMFAEYFWLEDRTTINANESFYVFRKIAAPTP